MTASSPKQTARQTTSLREPAEREFAEELAALGREDKRQKPPNWRLSPWAVVTYLLGGKLDSGATITPKYVGQKRLMEIAVATLATDRALLLLGLPGTAKSWVSEHLAAAISGDSTLLVQGTAGTGEEAMRYSWNYALLLAKGPTREALVASPVLHAMEKGSLVRLEELTRVPADVASGLIGAIVKDPVQDTVAWREYLETVVKERDGWKDLYRACRELL